MNDNEELEKLLYQTEFHLKNVEEGIKKMKEERQRAIESGKIKKYYELNPGDKADHGDGEVLEFIKVDGMYAQWKDSEGERVIGHASEYEFCDDGIYRPTSSTQ